MQLISELQRSKNSSLIKAEAKRLGFYDCGFSKAGHLHEEEARVEDWLSRGMHGEMSWLERNKEKRYNPEKLVNNAKSVISVIYNYTPKQKLSAEDNYRISCYAYGKDYHKVVKDKLFGLLGFIEKETGKREARVFVDSAPVLDRAWAHRAGLGFIGKNTMLINREGGSWFFIGHIILDLKLEYESDQPEKNFCGSCTLCIKACPTDALEPFMLDARKCISYLTIEHKTEIPEGFKGQFNNWIFGCDICQEVCPWNRDAIPHDDEEFDLSIDLMSMNKSSWSLLSRDRFNDLFGKSAVKRSSYEGLKRNIRYIEE